MKNQKKFGVWMDNHHATVVGNVNNDDDRFEVVSHVKGEMNAPNSSENAANNQERTLQAKFFKEISSHLVNATNIHVTGTGQAQEKFIHYLSSTPQFKEVKADQSTSEKMSDDKLIEFIAGKN